jgi:hypothetical protein
LQENDNYEFYKNRYFLLEVNPVDFFDEVELSYEGAGSLKLLVVDEDEGETEMIIDMV